MIRCPWVPVQNQLYLDYHDHEWGVPVHDDKRHFEFLILEGAQAGLSWETILKRRRGYKKAFASFNAPKVAAFSENDITRLLNDPGIIRNQSKIRSAVKNATVFLAIQKEFGSFDTYIWSFVAGKPVQHQLKTLADYPVFIPEAESLSKDLKKRGMNFVGPTIIYAHMQACGLVNDHTTNCFRRQEILSMS